MSITEGNRVRTRAGLSRNRWLQLALGVIAMVMIGNLQYGWTLFVDPIHQKFLWGRASIQVAFTLFVLFETWLVPLQAYFVDRFGPRQVAGTCALLVGAAWCINSFADSLPLLYLGAILGGVGAGGVYATAMGNALKWFKDRRGLAADLTAAGFGAGSALTVAPIATMIEAKGYEAAFLYFGIGQGLVVLIAAQFIREPGPGEVSSLPQVAQEERSMHDYRPLETLKTPLFWVLYAMMTMVATGGLMAGAQLGPIAKDFGVDNHVVTLGWIIMAALPFALSFGLILNGISRPFWGWTSDHIGREKTMTIVFSLEAVALVLLITTASNPVMVILFS